MFKGQLSLSDIKNSTWKELELLKKHRKPIAEQLDKLSASLGGLGGMVGK